jgi:hypothetical protein
MSRLFGQYRRDRFGGRTALLQSVACVFLISTALVAVPAHAAIVPVTFTGTSGSYAASAAFAVVGGKLQVTLTNTSSADVMAPGDVLTAVFFDLNPSIALTPISAVLGAGSTVLFGGTDPGGVVGGEWAYKSGLSGAPGNTGLGVSSSGLNLFGPPDLFPGSNLQGPDSPDGVQYGITSAGDNPAIGNAAVTGDNALIQNSVVFMLSGPSNIDPNTDISNVHFQYGTALTDTSFPGTSPNPGPSPAAVPEPATIIVWSLMFGSGWAGLRVWRRRQRPVGRRPWSPEAREAIYEIVSRGR